MNSLCCGAPINNGFCDDCGENAEAVTTFDDDVESSFFRATAYLLIAFAALMVLGYVVGAVTAGQ